MTSGTTFAAESLSLHKAAGAKGKDPEPSLHGFLLPGFAVLRIPAGNVNVLARDD